MTPGNAPLVGVDVGTTSVKAAAFDPAGSLLEGVQVTMPALETAGLRATQDVEAAVDAATRALEAVAGKGPPPAGVALTTQRDTLILLDGQARPLGPMISWRDMRDVQAPSVWDTLSPDTLSQTRTVRSLASHLAAVWTGRAAEAPGTVPRHLLDHALERLRALNPGVTRPDSVPVGQVVGRVLDAPLHAAGGDKNCELLGSGVTGPGQAALSLGSAISLGMVAAGPAAETGVVTTAGALEGRWDAETGLVGGLDGVRQLEALAGPPPPLAPFRSDVPLCLPYFAGALDAPEAAPGFVGLGPGTPPAHLWQAWAQGVLGELRRLRPRLEASAGTALEHLVVSGGGGADPGWASLAAQALVVPARPSGDPYRGARGAVASALARETPAGLGAFVAGGAGPEPDSEPDPALAPAVERYYAAWDAAAAAARAPHTPSE